MKNVQFAEPVSQSIMNKNEFYCAVINSAPNPNIEEHALTCDDCRKFFDDFYDKYLQNNTLSMPELVKLLQTSDELGECLKYATYHADLFDCAIDR